MSAAPRKIIGRIDYTADAKGGNRAGTQNATRSPAVVAKVTKATVTPLQARARVANGSPAGLTARVAPESSHENSLSKTASSSSFTASDAGIKAKRVRAASAEPDSPANALPFGTTSQAWEVKTPPPLQHAASMPVGRRVLASPAASPRPASPRRALTSTPTTIGTLSARSAPASPDVTRARKRSDSGSQATLLPSPARGLGLLPPLGPMTPPALSPTTSWDSASSSVSQRPVSPSKAPLPRSQPPSANVATLGRHRSDSATSLSQSTLSTAQELSVEDRLVQEKEAWLAAKKLQDAEENARTDRKMRDLQITVNSLTAINQALERNKLKQTAEIREMRQSIQSGIPLASPLALLSSPGLLERAAPITSAETEAEQEWEDMLEEDPDFARILQSVDELIKQAQRSIDSVAAAPAIKVLQPQLLEPPDQDLEASSDEEGLSVETRSQQISFGGVEVRDVGVQTDEAMSAGPSDSTMSRFYSFSALSARNAV